MSETGCLHFECEWTGTFDGWRHHQALTGHYRRETPPGLTTSPEHVGDCVWKNSAELVWECADDCPHPSHEEQP